MPIFRSLSIVTVAAILLNAMAPTLAHAAKYLQGAEVNADMLVQDAYVAVIYYDNNGEQKLSKGWINAIDETTFQIRSRAIFGKETIAYDKVLSVIMSEDSTTPIKQINEVDRFIRERQEGQRTKSRSTRIGDKLAGGLVSGILFAVVGAGVGLINGDSCKNAGSICIDNEVALGLVGGYALGVSAGVSLFDPHDQFISALGGTLIGGGAGIGLTFVDYKLWPSILIAPVIGATIMSELTRKPPGRLNLSVAPTSTKGLRASLTFNF